MRTKGNIPNILYDTSVTLIPKTDKDTVKKDSLGQSNF